MEQIDLVYLWVDGSDPEWQLAKERALQECGREPDRQATAKGRFANNDELRYSLRSVERYMPWVGRIFVVTANQTPTWLNTDHPKIRLISHSEIMDASVLPTFNSSAIEMSICRIEGLSERFILANDDFFVARPLTPQFFYNAEGVPIARLSRHIPKKQSLYMGKVRRAQSLVAEKFGYMCPNPPHHNMDAYLRSDVEACLEAFALQAEATRSHRFRAEGEFHRSAWLYYALSQGRAEKRIVTHYGAATSFGEKLGCWLRGRYCCESREFGLHRSGLARRLRRYNPALFCLNDTERTTDAQRNEMVGLLEELYGQKSSFEK